MNQIVSGPGPKIRIPASTKGEISSRDTLEKVTGPDLTIDRFRASNPFPRQGESVNFFVGIRNQGTAESGPFTLEIRSPGSKTLVEPVENLKPDDYVWFSTDSVRPRLEGSQFFQAVVDPQNSVKETREDNNSAQTAITVVGRPLPRP